MKSKLGEAVKALKAKVQSKKKNIPKKKVLVKYWLYMTAIKKNKCWLHFGMNYYKIFLPYCLELIHKLI